MTVATLNPFDLLNEELAAASKKAVGVKTTAPVTATAKATAAAVKAPAVPAKKPVAAPVAAGKVREMNASAVPSDVKEDTRRRSSGAPASGAASTMSDRQARRKTDRHSRTGYKPDGEKKMTGGKGSWGKSVEASEVVETAETAEAVETVDAAKAETAASPIETGPAKVTLAQYQATLKKPLNVSSSSLRQVQNSALASGRVEIVKKADEVFVFPEIVKAAPAATAMKSKKAVETVDLSKYITVRAVSSIEPSTTTSTNTSANPRDSRDSRGPRIPRESQPQQRNGRNSAAAPRAANTQDSRPATNASKINLKDDCAFPSLGKN